MSTSFAAPAFLESLKQQFDQTHSEFEALGFFDTRFGIRLLDGEGGEPKHLVVMEFETYSCKELALKAGSDPADSLDFVIEAPEAVWQDMLTHLDAQGHIEGDYTINTLSHFDTPIRIDYRDHDGLDKLFRFQQSVQLVFDIAARTQQA